MDTQSGIIASHPTDAKCSEPLVNKDSTTSGHIVVCKPDCLYEPRVADVITRKPEFSILIRCYNLLYQSLIPNCKLTIKTLKKHLEITSDVESFILSGESSRIRCQRILNLLLHSANNYKHFCYLFSMISVMTYLPDELGTDNTHKAHPSKLITTSSVNQLDDCAADNIIVRYFDDGASDDRENNSISDHNQVIGKRRCGPVASMAMNDMSAVWTETTTNSNTVTNDDHYMHTNSSPGPESDSTDETFRTSPQSSTRSMMNGHTLQVSVVHLVRSKYDAIVQSLPSDYEKTLQVVQGQLTDDQICDVLTRPNYTTANKTILNFLMEKVKCAADIVEFCDQLEKITSLKNDPEILPEIIRELKTTSTLPNSFSEVAENPFYTVPQKIISDEDFTTLKTHYHTILQLMPDSYEQSVGKLQDYFSDDQICVMLSSSNSTTANKIILDCLIERMSCREELLDLCDQLETISTSQQLMMVISEIRSEFTTKVLCSQPSTTTGTISLPNSVNSSSGSPYPTTLHHASNNSSVGGWSTPGASTDTTEQGYLSSSRMELEGQLRHDHKRLEKGIKCPSPPPLPPNYVCRQNLLDEIVTKLCQSAIGHNSYEISLTVTGAGGFGKTSIVTALCHHPLAVENFPDGFVFVELGPQATDPSMKLSQLYHLLTGQYLKQGDINHAEQEINQLTSHYCRNLLVIIDDVWHVEDAEPIVKAFNNCKIVLTTRMNDIEQYIPTRHVVTVGPMEQSEAICLLTCDIIKTNQLSQEDVILLDELAQDVHLWPLLLSLIRGQLSHNLKHYRLSYHIAIENVQAKLHGKGLTAFDKNNIERSRKYAVKACIEVTLEMLTKTLSDKMKSLILWTGIGTSLQTAVLHILWNITEQEARDTADALWAYGLIHFTEIAIPPHNNIQHCAEVHAVISQFITETMNSNEVVSLSPITGLGTGQAVSQAIRLSFKQSSGFGDLSSLTTVDCLKYRLTEIENDELPFYLKQINMYTITDPHLTILALRKIKKTFMASPNIKDFLPSLHKQNSSLISNLHSTLKDAHSLSRKLNQNVQRCLTLKNYKELIQSVEWYNKNYPIGLLAQQAVTLVHSFTECCDGLLADYVKKGCEALQVMTPDYHEITLWIIPNIKLLTNELEQINNSLLMGTPHIDVTFQYYASGKYEEDKDSLTSNYLMKRQEVAPNFVLQQTSRQH